MVRVRHDPEHTAVGYEFAMARRRREQKRIDLLRIVAQSGGDPEPLRRALVKRASAAAREFRTCK